MLFWLGSNLYCGFPLFNSSLKDRNMSVRLLRSIVGVYGMATATLRYCSKKIRKKSCIEQKSVVKILFIIRIAFFLNF